MTTAVELLRQGRRDEFWQRYCGFLDLGIEEFMAIQERLLVEQLHLLAGSELGRDHRARMSRSHRLSFAKLHRYTYTRITSHILIEQREDCSR